MRPDYLQDKPWGRIGNAKVAQKQPRVSIEKLQETFVLWGSVSGGGGGGGDALLLDGTNEMSAPINADPGSVTDPSVRNKDNDDTGMYFPATDKIGFALGAMLTFLLENNGMSLVLSGNSGKIVHHNTDDREYELPDVSGRLLVERTSSVGDNLTISVTTSAQELLAADPDRIGGIIVNNTDTVDIYIGLANTVVVGTTADANGGIRIRKGGGSFSLGQLAGYTGAIYGITVSGTAIVAVASW